jgi:hypothetical protein
MALAEWRNRILADRPKQIVGNSLADTFEPSV